MIITRTPFRVSFFGGGTDIPSWYRENGGMVVVTTIDKYCYISCRPLPPFFEHKHRIVWSQVERVMDASEIKHPAVRAILQWLKFDYGLEIHHNGDLPARSGLGSSSAFCVGLIHALRALEGKMLSHHELAQEAIHVEQDLLRENVGCQDQLATAHGGFNKIEFKTTGEMIVSPVVLPAERMDELQSHLLLVYTGVARTSSEIAESTFSNLQNRKGQLRRIYQMADEALRILQQLGTPIRDFGVLLNEAWQYKKELSSSISTDRIDEIYQAARSAGAIGGKLLGAGGGGFFLMMVHPDKMEAVTTALHPLITVPVRFESAGSTIAFYGASSFSQFPQGTMRRPTSAGGEPQTWDEIRP